MAVDRRGFTRASVLTAAVVVAGPAVSSRAAHVPAVSAPAGASARQQAQEPSAEARALGEWLRARYGDRLTANEFADVVRDIEGGLRRAARLNAPPLTNGDEPDFTFHAYRGGD